MSSDQAKSSSSPQRAVVRADRVAVAATVFMALGLTAVVGRVAQVQLAPGASLSAHIDDRITRTVQPGPRGDILDRRGRVLAATRTGYRLFVDPSVLTPPFGALIQQLGEATGVDPTAVAEIVVGKSSASAERVSQGRTPIRYAPIGGILDGARLEAARRLAIPGVHLEEMPVREVTGGDAIAPLIGKVDVDHKGLLGAELGFDGMLRPKVGHLDYVRDARGRPMWVEATGYKTPEEGSAVRLSVDVEIQRIALEELKRGVEEADAAGGRLVMIDPATGDVLALVDHVRDVPGLEEPPARVVLHGRIVEPDSSGHRYRTIRPDPGREIHPALARNRCIEDVYEPGSTFKSFVWSSIVERGVARSDEVFNTYDGAWVTDYGRVIRDVSPKPQLTWTEVLIYSSNIGMVQGAARVPFSTMRNDLLRFGFGRSTGLGLPGESPGIVTSPKNWSKYTQTSIASGYEIAVTPLQMVRAFSVFARNGELAGTLPNLRLRIDPEADPEAFVRYQVLPSWVAHLTRDTLVNVGKMMEQRARLRFKDEPPLKHSIFGKSGTAEIPRPDGRGYFRGQYNSSFLAGAPADDPRIVLVVVIDDPGPELIRKRSHYGTAVAGPVVRRVVRRTLEYMGVPAPGDPVAELMAEFENSSGNE